MPEQYGRLDKWLWCARIVRTRKLARNMVATGLVRLNRRKVAKPGHGIQPGDVLTFVWAERLRCLKIISVPLRRDRPAAARALYEELTAPD